MMSKCYLVIQNLANSKRNFDNGKGCEFFGEMAKG